MSTTEAQTTLPPVEGELEPYIWIIVAVVCLIVLLLFVYLAYKLYKRCTRFDYTPLKDDLALPEKLSHAKQIQRNEVRENALLNFQFYLRSQTGRYTFNQHLPDMGSRVDKHWFLVRHHGRWKDLVVTQCAKSHACPFSFNPSNQKTIRDMLLALEHPYIWPIIDIDLWEDHEMVIAVQEFNSSGSLKDYIYNVKPCHDWSNKYGMQSRGLPLKQIKLFGLQILTAILYLQENGFPPHGHLQAGNVIIKKGACRLSANGNVLLGYTSKLHPLIRQPLKDKPEAIDTISFGHLMYEMGAGREMEKAVPTRAQLNRCKHSELIQLLEFIFDVAGDYPTIAAIADHHFFIDVKLKEFHKHQPKRVHLTAAMKSLIKAVKKGKGLNKSRSSRSHQNSRSSKNKNKGSSKRTSNAGIPGQTDSTPSKLSSSASLVSAPPPSSLQPLAVPSPPPVVGFAPAANGSARTTDIPNGEGRGALLSDIRKGMTLRKTTTCDRSTRKV